jgi:imidazolonepropionase-like amidohydrolase
MQQHGRSRPRRSSAKSWLFGRKSRFGLTGPPDFFGYIEDIGRGTNMQKAKPAPCVSILMVFLAAGALAATPPQPTKPVVYLGATLIDGTGSPARQNMAIVTQNDRIIAVRPAEGFDRAGQQIVDVRNKFIVPGLVNSHVHVATLAEPKVAKAYLRRELYSGVTTVRDMAGDVRLIAELKREAYFNEIASPDIYFVALMAGPSFFVDPRTHEAARGLVAGQVPWMQAITPTTDLKLAVAEAHGTGATAIKIYADLPASLVSAITAEAHRQHMQVWAHAAVFPAIPSEVVDAGVDVISHACLLGFEVSNPVVPSREARIPVDSAKVLQPSAKLDALFADIKRRGTILDATLFPFDAYPFPICPPDTSVHLAREAFKAGIPISAGTDDDADWKDPDSALDTELDLLVAKLGMSPAQAIHSATLIGARAAGAEKEVGTIEPGKLANLVILDKDPLKNIANMRSVHMVVKRGVRYLRADYRPAKAADFAPPTH